MISGVYFPAQAKGRPIVAAPWNPGLFVRQQNIHVLRRTGGHPCPQYNGHDIPVAPIVVNRLPLYKALFEIKQEPGLAAGFSALNIHV